MNKKLGRTHLWLISLVSFVLGLLVFIVPACKKEPSPTQTASPGAAAPKAGQAAQSGKEVPLRLSDIISLEKSWNPALEAFAGKPAPDFTVKDLSGQEFKLSAVRGKNVMVVIWAPSCGPCKMEIPDLVELRKTIGQDQLAIVAVSFTSQENSEEVVRQFVQQNGTFNYPVAAVDKDSLPAPFNASEYIPATFWIAPDGTLKLTTVGVVPLSDMKAIVKASGPKAVATKS
jgi:thiol-disulfide isomerase/thioredoxin